MGRIREPRDPGTLPKGGWVGVDPGKTGTIGYCWDGGVEVWRFERLTDVEIWEIFAALSGKAKAAALEKVSANPKDGKVQAFKFGHAAGKVEGWLVASRMRWNWVTPAKWQGDLRCRTAGDKKVTQAEAQKLWPNMVWTQKNSEGPLIAEWCRVHSNWGR